MTETVEYSLGNEELGEDITASGTTEVAPVEDANLAGLSLLNEAATVVVNNGTGEAGVEVSSTVVNGGDDDDDEDDESTVVVPPVPCVGVFVLRIVRTLYVRVKQRQLHAIREMTDNTAAGFFPSPYTALSPRDSCQEASVDTLDYIFESQCHAMSDYVCALRVYGAFYQDVWDGNMSSIMWFGPRTMHCSLSSTGLPSAAALKDTLVECCDRIVESSADMGLESIRQFTVDMTGDLLSEIHRFARLRGWGERMDFAVVGVHEEVTGDEAEDDDDDYDGDDDSDGSSDKENESPTTPVRRSVRPPVTPRVRHDRRPEISPLSLPAATMSDDSFFHMLEPRSLRARLDGEAFRDDDLLRSPPAVERSVDAASFMSTFSSMSCNDDNDEKETEEIAS